MLRKAPLALAIAAAWSALLPAARAQQRADEAKPPLERAAPTLPEVIATGPREAQVERKNAVVQKIVISEEEIERYGDASVGDVLRRLVGTTFTGPPGTAKDVRMRGLDKGYTQFLVNGEPVPGAVKERQMQVDRLPADMIERIEIVRSPSAEHDAVGIGGTIDIVLKNRADGVTRLRVAAGRNGRLDVGDVIGQWSRRFDDVDVLLALSHTLGAEDVVEHKETFNAAGALTQSEHKRKPVRKTETLFTPRVAWRLGEHRLTLDAFLSDGTEEKRETSEARDTAGAPTKSVSNEEDKTDRIGRVAARYDGRLGAGTWSARLGAQRGETGKLKFGTERNGSNVVTKRTEEREEVREDHVYAGVSGALPLGPHLLKAGLDRRDTEHEKRKTVAEAGNATAPLAPKAPGANDIYAIDETQWAAYLQDDWRVADAHWLTAGIRWQRTERDATDRHGVTASGAQSAPNPSLHYRWAATKNTNVRASVARTLKLPTFDDVNPLVTTAGGANPGTITNPDKGGNADSRPERATGIELGVEQFLRGNRGVVGLNAYHRDVKDFIQKSTRQEGARFVERPHNVGEARFWGVELDWRLPLLHRGPHALAFSGSHAELRGEVTNAASGVRSGVKDMPRRVTNLALDWRHRPTRWSAGVALNHTPAFATDTVNPDGVREIKRRNASTLLDLYVAKVLGPMAEFRLVAKNVLSVTKEEAVTKFNAAGAVNISEAKTERSKPTIFAAVESRF